MSSSTEIDAAKLVETRSQDKDAKSFARPPGSCRAASTGIVKRSSET